MRVLDYEWKLRPLMAQRGMYATTDLDPLLRERGITLSSTQIYRLVTGKPERLNLAVLVALCDALGCEAGDLIQPVVVATARRKRSTGTTDLAPVEARNSRNRPVRARITPAE
ncbi:MAG: XRE family transcriptional regulator [Actinobacteria bacterium]|nr:XRE family transcriptional regulator [Actinomycetota bacterium]